MVVVKQVKKLLIGMRSMLVGIIIFTVIVPLLFLGSGLTSIYGILERHNFFYKYLKLIIILLLILLFGFIGITIFILLKEVFFHGLVLGYESNLEYGEKIQLSLYIFQIVIISFGIFVGYLNFRELLRKNMGDHYPKVKLGGVQSIVKKTYIDILLNFENTGENVVELNIGDIEFDGLLRKVLVSKKNENYKKKYKIYNKTRPVKEYYLHSNRYYFETLFDTNVFYKDEKTTLVARVYRDYFDFFHTVQNLEIEIFLKSYGLTRKAKIILSNDVGEYNFTLSKYILV